jgi:hypothetical protein
MKKLILTTIILTVSFSLHAQNWWKNKKVRGNGNVISKTRTISDFEAFMLAGHLT